jgi:Secretion system C-terminal sorting domain
MKHFFALGVAMLAAFALHAQAKTKVTFAVDMSKQTVGAKGVHIAGDFQKDAGMSGDWDPGAAAGALTDPDKDGIYTVTYDLLQKTYNFKFLNGDAWGTDEAVPGACATGGNRTVVVGATAITRQVCFGTCDEKCPSVIIDVDVTFRVNTNGITVKEPGMIIAGGFGAAGLPNWNGNADGIVMEDPDKDGIWEKKLKLKTGSYPYKFLNGANGWENVPCACNISGNREAVVGTNPAPITVSSVFYNDCDNTFNGTAAAPVTFRVDMSAEALGVGGLFVAGSFQQNQWTKNVDRLTDANNDGIFEITLNVPPGEHEWKFFNGDFSRGPNPSNSDQFAEGTGYDFRRNGCACASAGFNNRILNISSNAPMRLPVYVYNSCQTVTVSTNDLSSARNIRVYPNPVTGQYAYIEFEGLDASEHNATIVDQLGRVVRTYSDFSGTQLQIEKGELTAGIYFVTLQNRKGERATTRLTIQ